MSRKRTGLGESARRPVAEFAIAILVLVLAAGAAAATAPSTGLPVMQDEPAQDDPAQDPAQDEPAQDDPAQDPAQDDPAQDDPAVDEPGPLEEDPDAVDLTPAPEGTTTPVPGSLLETSASFPYGFVASDSELVYGPSLYGFDTEQFVDARAGYLSQHHERFEGEILRGPQIVERVAQSYSVGPRVLLTLIEVMSGWVTNAAPADRADPLRSGIPTLGAGLTAAADALNAAYYGRRLQNQVQFTLSDGAVVALPSANAGTFAVVAYLGSMTDSATWPGLESPSQFVVTWQRLFGDPPAYFESFTRPPLDTGPSLALPFPAAELWFYTSGPHPPIGSGASWAALGFAPPPQEATGCSPSASWVTAASGGLILDSPAQMLFIDSDEDAFVGTGWVHVYRHLSVLERVPTGKLVRRGERLGHPSCEGGGEAPARVSFARRYEGEWIAATDARAPMILGGWYPMPAPRAGTGLLDPGTSGSDLPARVPGAAKLPAANGIIVRP